MHPFRVLLIAFVIILVPLTVLAVAQEGWNLVPPFVDPVIALTWQGQFNADFTTYLILSGVWMAWRGGFTGRSIALGLCAPALGMLFFAPYLLYLIRLANGDPKTLLLGVHAT